MNYITNPPSAIPPMVLIPASQATQPFSVPPGSVMIPAWPNFPGSPAGTPVLPADFLVQQFVEGYLGTPTTGGIEANTEVINAFEGACEMYLTAQRATFAAVGQPSGWTPAPAPVAPNLPFGPCTVVMDPNVVGQGWVLPTSPGPAAGTCPAFNFTPPALKVVFGLYYGKPTFSDGIARNMWSGFNGTTRQPGIATFLDGGPSASVENPSGFLPPLDVYQVLQGGFIVEIGQTAVLPVTG